MGEIFAEQLDRHRDAGAGLARWNDIRKRMSSVVAVRLLAARRDDGRSTDRHSFAVGAAPVPYCVDAHGNADPVVFQGGIAIDPDTARVTRGGSTDGVVTLSCRSGAPATVYSWGYRHREDAYYFDAALQMKRASYCGDGATYTRSATLIDIADDRGGARSPLARLEARWTPTGASCVNRDHLRHPELAVEKRFTFTCQGRSLPPCTTPALERYLASDITSSGR